MSSLLVKNALDKVWSVPDPFNQVILQPARITPINGVQRQFTYAWDNIALPNNTSTFHLYQIGQIFPATIDLFTASTAWTLFSDATNATNVVCDIYSHLGIQIPKTRTWFQVTENKNVIIAIEKNNNLNYDFNTDAVSLRIYLNAYFQTGNISANDKVLVAGGLITSTAQITTLNNQINTILNASYYIGGLYLFINGYKQQTLNVSTVTVGDVAEFVYDSSIYKVADFRINDLASFDSILDNKNKLLLHYSGNSDGFIDYIDNIDVYMIDGVTHKGVYVHKNAADTLRMVTHKDYSIVSGYLLPYFQHFKNSNGSINVNNLYLRLHVRYSGKPNVPLLENNQINYLMKLPDAQLVQAMVGTNSNVSIWRAAALENCGYTAIMRSNYNQITQSLAESAYGYTTTNKLYADTPLPVMVAGSSRTVNIPPAFQISSTAFEYNAAGVLLGYHIVPPNTIIYIPTAATATLVEFVSGIGSNILDETYEVVPTLISPINNYRYYINVLDQPNGSYLWKDVTLSNYNTVVSGVSTWTDGSLLTILKRIVRSDKNFLLYQTVLNPTDGVLIHQLTYTQNTMSGQISSAMTVPMGELDLWLNGKSLVRGIDYNVNFPTVVVTNKTYLNATPGPQVLTVRFTGFCNSNMTMADAGEVGFVYNGALSANGVYDLHDGRVQRVIVGGATVSSNAVTFIENNPTGLIADGLPYSIRDVVNPLNGIVASDPYMFYKSTKANEKLASDYLTLHLPQVLGSPINPITNKYVIYSPFICKIIYDLSNGYLMDATIAGQYPDSFVVSKCAPYLYLLKNDPINPNNLPDLRYIVIHPHWLNTSISLDANNYRFISNVVRIYANGIVNLTPLVIIGS